MKNTKPTESKKFNQDILLLRNVCNVCFAAAAIIQSPSSAVLIGLDTRCEAISSSPLTPPHQLARL
jgi:hypothetical protein